MIKDNYVYDNLNVRIKTELSRNGPNNTQMLHYQHEENIICKYKPRLGYTLLYICLETQCIYIFHITPDLTSK
jgi:hypothetical protein